MGWGPLQVGLRDLLGCYFLRPTLLHTGLSLSWERVGKSQSWMSRSPPLPYLGSASLPLPPPLACAPFLPPTPHDSTPTPFLPLSPRCPLQRSQVCSFSMKAAPPWWLGRGGGQV